MPIFPNAREVARTVQMSSTEIPRRNKMKLARHLFTAAAMAFFSCMQAGHASTFPERGITIVNPFPPGSPVDFLGRLVASELDALWDPYVVVENKTGAGGTVGTNYVVKSKPD